MARARSERGGPVCVLFEERQIDRFAHGLIAGVARVQRIAAVEGGFDFVRRGGVADSFVEIDEAVEAFSAVQ